MHTKIRNKPDSMCVKISRAVQTIVRYVFPYKDCVSQIFPNLKPTEHFEYIYSILRQKLITSIRLIVFFTFVGGLISR